MRDKHEKLQSESEGASNVIGKLKPGPYLIERKESVRIPMNYQNVFKSLVYQSNNSGQLDGYENDNLDEFLISGMNKDDKVNLFRRLFQTCFRPQQPFSDDYDDSYEFYGLPQTNSFTSTRISPTNSPTALSKPILGRQRSSDSGKMTLVLDLDETLIHSSFQRVKDFNFSVRVEVNGYTYSVYIALRPGALEFLRELSQLFEIVVFTASVQKYADPVLNAIDPFGRYISHRLYREHCTLHNGVLVKDLHYLGRDLTRVIIIDNAKMSFSKNPSNGIECATFMGDNSDNELTLMIPFLIRLSKKKDVRGHTTKWAELRESMDQTG